MGAGTADADGVHGRSCGKARYYSDLPDVGCAGPDFDGWLP